RTRDHEPASRCPGHPGGTATGSESSTRALSSNAQGGKNMRKGFAAVFSVVASSVLLSGLTEAHVTDVQAPRMQEVQAPRMQEVQAPRMQEVQAPRMQDVQAPRMQDVQAPRTQEVQAPRRQHVPPARTQDGQPPGL